MNNPFEDYLFHPQQAPDKDKAPVDAPLAKTEARFPCNHCGGDLAYAIGTDDLRCSYCGRHHEIDIPDVEIEEINLPKGLERLEKTRQLGTTETVLKCPNCAAQFDMDEHVHSGDCPFCGTSVVTSTGQVHEFSPQAVLPFAITRDEAFEAYTKWIAGRWFAPSKLKNYARESKSLKGVYIPYWTYDSDTVTSYAGQRGDVYYVRQNVTVMENGRYVRRSRMVPKIRWTSVQGRTDRHFDDLLIGATRTLPRKITDWLEPWDLQNLVPYTEEYLSGFQSEVYQVALDEGFTHAERIMQQVIRGDVNHAIGGDQQRIVRLHTNHTDTTFKHVLLPLWTAAFTFKNKTYRFVVNGRNGKTRGERPYSIIKIAIAGVTAAVVIGTGTFALQSGSGGGYLVDRPIFYPDRYERRNNDPFRDLQRLPRY